MQTTEKPSPAESIRTTQPEHYDLVILGGGHGVDRRRMDVCQ
jgi:hypothetical protein